jgi:hypothetical protein
VCLFSEHLEQRIVYDDAWGVAAGLKVLEECHRLVNQPFAATRSDDRAGGEAIELDPGGAHLIEEGNDPRPRAAHLAVHVQHDVVDDERGHHPLAPELGEELERALVPAHAGERVQHSGVGADVQAVARWERHFVEHRADGVVLALVA